MPDFFLVASFKSLVNQGLSGEPASPLVVCNRIWCRVSNHYSPEIVDALFKVGDFGFVFRPVIVHPVHKRFENLSAQELSLKLQMSKLTFPRKSLIVRRHIGHQISYVFRRNARITASLNDQDGKLIGRHFAPFCSAIDKRIG